MKLKVLCLVVAGFVFLTVILSIRTTGIHIDESAYLQLAANTRIGDSVSTGKPVLFYWMNYKIYHEIGRSLGPLKPVAIYLTYILIFAASLAWALLPVFKNRPGSLALVYAVLLLSPIALLNSTQVMMETALLSAVSLLFGAMLRGTDSFGKSLRIFLCSALLIALKVTGVSVLILLTLAFLRRSKKCAVLLWSGALTGAAANMAVLTWIVKYQHADNYGGIGEILHPAAVWERMTHFSLDVYLWLYFVGIAALLGAILFAASRSRAKDIDRKIDGVGTFALITMAGGSLVATLFMQGISTVGMARYNYPALWLGLIASVLLVERYRTAMVLLLAVVFGIQSSALWGYDSSRFHFWPTRTVSEFFESGGTVLMSTPVHRLVVQQMLRSPSPCWTLESEHPDGESVLMGYFAYAFPMGRALERGASAADCSTTIHLWRDRAEKIGACPERSEKPDLWKGCSYQHLSFFSGWPLALNQISW